jgi:opacity protein-like surface antigen
MKKVFLLIVGFVLTASAFAQTKLGGEKGVSSVGILAGYAVDNKTFTAGFDFRYNVLDRLRLAPSVMYLFTSNYYIPEYKGYEPTPKFNTWYANVDVHYLLRVTREMTIYPLAGVGLSVWQYDLSGLPAIAVDGIGFGYELFPETLDDTKVRLGLNLGVGIERRMTRDIILGAEFKYNLTSENLYNQAMILGRVAYYF